jgi:4-amino-4-deoxy-L-arabinose transferase-like glycosyltransferase
MATTTVTTVLPVAENSARSWHRRILSGHPAAARSLRALRSRAPLLCLLILQTALSLRLDNTAFQDEALYLYAGHREIAQLLHHTPTYDNYASYFSGMPFLYPVLGALADSAAGLAGARALSLVLMLATTVLLYCLTRRLFGRQAGLLAAAAFALTGPTLFLGHLATYDATALFLLALASWIAVRTMCAPLAAVLLAGPPLVLAALVKYAALLFVPTVVVLAALAAVPDRGWWRAALRGLLLAGTAVACGYGVLRLAGPAFLAGVHSTTTARQPGTDPARVIAWDSVRYGGVVLALAVAGIPLLVRAHGAAAGARRDSWPGRLALGVLLSGTALLAPASQIHLHTLTSLHKHVGYGLFFAAPMAGYALSRLVGSRLHDPRRLGLALGACLLIAELGIQQSTQFFRQWPNTARLVGILRTQVRPVSGHYLVEESEVPRYYLRDLVQPYQWTGTYYFAYTDRKGRQYTGVPAYQAAIADHYFDLVMLRYGPTSALDHQIDAGLTERHGYHLITKAKANSSYGAGTWYVWQAGG